MTQPTPPSNSSDPSDSSGSRPPGTDSPATCANCGAPVDGEYCGRCGQGRRDLRIPLASFAADALEEIASFDTRALRTLRPLLLRPGRLTRQVLAGRRARYVPPLRLYLFVSFVFFLSAQLLGNDLVVVLDEGEEPEQASIVTIWASSDEEEPAAPTPTTGEGSSTVGSDDPSSPGSEGEGAGAGASGGDRKGPWTRIAEAFAEDPGATSNALAERLPAIFFLLVPIAAIWLRILFRRYEPYYVPHLVTSLHIHAGVMMLMILSYLIEPLSGPGIGRIATVAAVLIGLWLPIYVVLSLRHVYDAGWWATLWRAGVFAVLHLLSLMAGLVASAALFAPSLN